MKTTIPLQPGRYYHIYNRGNNRENLFREERNYRYFLQLYSRHIQPVADTLAYCLMRNHFHLLIRTKETGSDSETSEALTSRKIAQHFSNLFNAYAKAINKAYGRTGSVFEERFGRIEVTSDHYLLHLIFYIHCNPQKHGFVTDFRAWPWSAYHSLRTTAETKLDRVKVLEWFGTQARFDQFHLGRANEQALIGLVDEDLV